MAHAHKEIMNVQFNCSAWIEATKARICGSPMPDRQEEGLLLNVGYHARVIALK